MGVKIKDLPLRIGVFGAEPWTIAMRKEIEERMEIKAMEAYGLTECGAREQPMTALYKTDSMSMKITSLQKLSIR